MAGLDVAAVEQWLQDLVVDEQRIHDQTCVNLNPATNQMNPQEPSRCSPPRLRLATLAGLSRREYEMGLEAIEQIEVIAAELAARVFHADYAEVRGRVERAGSAQAGEEFRDVIRQQLWLFGRREVSTSPIGRRSSGGLRRAAQTRIEAVAPSETNSFGKSAMAVGTRTR